MNRWYVVKTHPLREQYATDGLKRQNFIAFNPLLKRRAMRRGIVQEIIEPRFPTYVLVNFDLLLDEWEPINGTRGVQRVMGGEQPLPLPQGFVETLEPLFEPVPGGLVAGDPVKLTGGVFPGAAGRFIAWVDDGRRRAACMLALLGRETRVELPGGMVERGA